MKVLAIAYLLAVAVYLLPLACAKDVPAPGVGRRGCNPPECLMALECRK
jgi:hypothetical protein